MPYSQRPEVILVSACLVGLSTRYDQKIKPDTACMRELSSRLYIPFCPEQLGGLPTPREAAVLTGGDGYQVLAGKAKVVSRSGRDVSAAFINGAYQALTICEQQHICRAYLKANSPSCGLSGTTGVTAALLSHHKIDIVEF